jgi:hypothetical protein
MATLATRLPTTVQLGAQTRTENRLLRAGMVAGPFYVTVALAQSLTRPGFDLRRHDISLLAIGSLGWIQIANFVISGLLTITAAVGMRRALVAGPGRNWGPRLVAVYGAGIALAGLFVADPMGGFPPDATNSSMMSWHGGLHLLCAAVAFVALIAACFVLAGRFFREGQRAWGSYSLINGALFVLTFFGSVIFSASPATAGLGVLGLWIAVLLGWSWLAVISAKAVQA